MSKISQGSGTDSQKSRFSNMKVLFALMAVGFMLVSAICVVSPTEGATPSNRDKGPIYLDTTDISEAEMAEYSTVGKAWYTYDPTTNTGILVLDNFQYSTESNSAVIASVDLMVEVHGRCLLMSTYSDGDSSAFYNSNDTTIKGTINDTLTIECKANGSSCALYVSDYRDLDIVEGVNLVAKAASTTDYNNEIAIRSYSISVRGGSSVTATAGSDDVWGSGYCVGISVLEKFLITEGSHVTATSYKGEYTSGIAAKSIVVKSSTVVSNGGYGYEGSCGIYVSSSIVIGNGSDIRAVAGDYNYSYSNGIFCDDASVSIRNSSIVAKGFTGAFSKTVSVITNEYISIKGSMGFDKEMKDISDTSAGSTYITSDFNVVSLEIDRPASGVDDAATVFIAILVVFALLITAIVYVKRKA